MQAIKFGSQRNLNYHFHHKYYHYLHYRNLCHLIGQRPAYLKVGVARSKHLFGPYTKSDTPVVQTDWER